MGPALEGALSALRKHGWVDDSQLFYAHLCLEEALVNAITHGNHCDPKRKVRLEMAEEEGACVIRVWDEGRGFSVTEVPPPDCESEGGRGLCLIEYCMDDVYYDEREHCLVMRMGRKTLSKGVSNHEQ